MTSLAMKIVICPIAVLLSSYIFPNVYYPNWFQAILVGIILAAGGVMLEYLFLREGTLWSSNIIDFVASFLIVYFVSQFLPGAVVTFWGAFLVALLITVTEHFQHAFLIRSGRTQKTA